MKDKDKKSPSSSVSVAKKWFLPSRKQQPEKDKATPSAASAATVQQRPPLPPQHQHSPSPQRPPLPPQHSPSPQRSPLPPQQQHSPSPQRPPLSPQQHQHSPSPQRPPLSPQQPKSPQLQRPQVGSALSDFPGEVAENGDMAAVMENLTQKSAKQQQQQISSASSSSSRISTSSSSSSQRVHVSTSSSELKATSMKSDLSELKSSISEMKNLSTLSSNMAAFANSRLRSSLEELDRDDAPGTAGSCEPLVTFPDPDTPPPMNGTVSLVSPPLSASRSPPLVGTPILGNGLASSMASATSSSSSAETSVKFEQKRVTSASKTKVVTEGFTAEQQAARAAETKTVTAGEMSYQEAKGVQALRQRLEMDGLAAEKTVAMKQEQRSLKAGELSQQENKSVAASCLKMHTENFSSEKKAVSTQQVVTSGVYNQENHVSSSHSSHSNITFKANKASSSSSVMAMQQQRMMHIKTEEEEHLFADLADLERLSPSSSQQEVDNAIHKYTTQLEHVIKMLRTRGDKKQEPKMLNRINDMIRKAWAVPTLGHELGHTLCSTLRKCGGLELLISNCVDSDRDLQYSSARLLEQCLTTENRAHVVDNGLEKVVNVACVCTKNADPDHARVGTGILEHLFKHSEGTCSDVIQLGGLDAVLFECRKNDIETLRHCAGALANLSLYGGADNQEAMIKRKVPMWLFPLAFHTDDNIKYYACLAIAVLVANTEIEAAVLQSGTLDLVEPFVTSHNPSDFARSNLAHAHGQSMQWLRRLVPVLSSKREEARNLAAFHFCMEAGIKKQQGNTEIFREIGAIEPLKKCASCPNAVASKYAAQALRLIGEEVPHKLSQQVPLWSTEDVREWVRQIGFAEYADCFVESRVDGDLLLQLTEDNLRTDIGILNGIRRRGFTRELQNLKKMADYSSKDASNLNSFLLTMGPEFSIYTYTMLNAGVDKDSIRCLSDDQLIHECGISNSIHRLKILESLRMMENCLDNSFQNNLDKPLDVFISYRRSNGSQLASLLKVHLQLRGFRVFIDVERLEAGKFDNNLLQSIKQARNFILVLTPNALDRCHNDPECKDWVHKEIVAALDSQCNIIPITDNFSWPEPEELPEDMRAVCHFNGVRWIHDYQDACVDKLERFMRGELGTRMGVEGPLSSSSRSMLSSKGDSTPGTLPGTMPGTPSCVAMGRHPPAYQRMHSNDSTKGSGSDKDRE
ncbi:sterile alpha and TIR motif-containing protein 1 isoform X3 [Thrips palmi]|uniref:ADP-ribosyl cyclase/cyclic ADP-ribose hydrolase n=1 Tax=Thrips palmi TaxID=161013 RepID=A0A6P8Z3G1_THRPL|nr:sterile alpha and TIR motif-containing protein 1 isoform X3 [Thrips palmi]